jgi:uncharacterized protein YgbK (DUF1537 family)
MLAGAVADDDSGMTDLLGMFAEHGTNAVLFFEVLSPDILEKYARDVEVVAIGTRARSIEPGEAYRKTKGALEALIRFNPRMFYLKYCSTFDSTPRGNIGQMIEAGLNLIGGYTIALPALPINGRTTYMGNHFVNGIRMDRSPMKDHPLNPMTEADLTVWLAHQTKRRIGLCDHNSVRRGARATAGELKRLAENGAEIIIVDAISQRDVGVIARAIWDHKLVSGSSALAMELPPIWRQKGWLSRRGRRPNIDLKRGADACLVIAGSCSEATMNQNRHALEGGFIGLKLDTKTIVEGNESDDYGGEVERNVRAAASQLRQGRNVLIYTAADKGDVDDTKALGRRLGLTDVKIGELIAAANSEVAKALVDELVLNKLVVAGGETSGAVCRKMMLIGLYVGKQVHPGVPMCFTISEEPQYSGMMLSLKSGNFGGPSFYGDALSRMSAYLHREL